MAKAKPKATPAELAKPLWPKPIPVLGLTGEYASGKTLFGLSISPGAGTKVFDLEKSSEPYVSLAFDRVDVPAEMLRQYPNGHKPVQLYLWWLDQVRAIPAGQYRVIFVDPVSEIESGLCDWVRSNPSHFGHTSGQYLKMEGLFWGDVKELWKTHLLDLASRCETFAFTCHMSNVFAGGKATSKRKPKGKETLTELASLYLQLERKPDAKGNVPMIPSALVRKTRLAHMEVGDDGELRSVPILPPRLPQATPKAIKEYCLCPPDWSALRPEELAPEEVMTDDERLDLRARTAEAEAETERLRAERSPKPIMSARLPIAVAGLPIAIEAEEEPGDDEPVATGKLTHGQLATLADLRDELFAIAEEEDPDQAWSVIISRQGVTTARDLTPEQADQLAARLREHIKHYKEHSQRGTF